MLQLSALTCEKSSSRCTWRSRLPWHMRSFMGATYTCQQQQQQQTQHSQQKFCMSREQQQ
jgi:hypothetical protein